MKTCKNKRRVAFASLAILTSVSAITPIVASCKNNFKLEFNNKLFNNKEELMDYANSRLSSSSAYVDEITNWSIKDNNQIKYLNNPYEAYTIAEKNIKPLNVFLTEDIKYDNNTGEVYSNELSKLLDVNAKDYTNDIITIYRGRNNSIYRSEQEAKNSYLEIHNTYYYKGIYFRNKEELANYLQKTIQSNKLVNDSFVINSPTGYKSIPFSTQELKESTDTQMFLKDFVKQNSVSYIKQYDKQNHKNKYFSESQLIKDSFKPTYTKIESNQGKGNWLVDLDQSDEYDLFGPYYVKSSSVIKKMKDPDSWTRIEGVDFKFIDNIYESNVISKGLNTIISSPLEINDKVPFNVNNKIIQKDIELYFETLKNDSPLTYQSVMDLYVMMKKGKKYSEFLKLPLLFFHTIDELIQRNSQQYLIDYTRKVYGEICEYWDDVLYSTFPVSVLRNNKSKEIFSFDKLFGIYNNDIDLNFDVESFIDIIVDNYPIFYNFLKIVFNLVAVNSQIGPIFSLVLKNFPKPKDQYFNELVKILEIDTKIIDLNDQNIYSALNIVFKIFNNTNEQQFLNLVSFLEQENSKEIKFKHTSLDLNNQSKIYVNDFYCSLFLNNKTNLEQLSNLVQWNIQSQHNISQPNFNIVQDSSTRSNIIQLINSFNITGTWGRIFNLLKININNVLKINPLVVGIINSLINNNFSWKIISIINSLTNVDINSPQFIEKIFELWLNQNNTLDKFINSISSFFTIPSSIIMMLNKVFDFSNRFQIINDNVNGYYLKFKSSGVQISLDKRKWQRIILDAVKVVANTTKDFLELASNLSKKLENVLSCLSTICPYLEIASFLLDFLSNIYKQECFSYQFKSEDVEYIWNGGKNNLWFYGMVTQPISSIKDQKLLTPFEVIYPNQSSYIYYNSKRYSENDLDSLKVDQIDDIFKGRYSTGEFELVYTFLNNKQMNSDSLYFNNLDSLAENVLSKINNWINSSNSNIPNELNFIETKKFSFANGVEYNNNLTMKNNINNVLNQIKPVKLAYLPKLSNTKSNSNKPITRNDGLDDDSLYEYKLPNRYYDPTQTNYYSINNERKPFKLIDMNESNQNDEQNAERKLKEEFYKSFDIDSKQVLIQQLKKNETQLFSDLKSIESKQLFLANDNKGNQKVFISKEDALNWVLSNLEFKTYWTKQEFNSFVYIDDKNLKFKSLDEYYNWVFKNAKEIR